MERVNNTIINLFIIHTCNNYWFSNHICIYSNIIDKFRNISHLCSRICIAILLFYYYYYYSNLDIFFKAISCIHGWWWLSTWTNWCALRKWNSQEFYRTATSFHWLCLRLVAILLSHAHLSGACKSIHS